MGDPAEAFIQLLAGKIAKALDLDELQISQALADDPGLIDELQSNEQLSQVISDDARGFQTWVQGGAANIGGTHFNVDAKALQDLGKLLQGLTQQNLPVGIPQNLPRSSAVQFVGREERLQALHQQVEDSDRITSIVGMGGLGKTELALQYAFAQCRADRYPGGGCWLRAKDEEIATQITSFARVHLDIAAPADLQVEDQVRYCWQRWPEGDVLVVIDDVTDFEAVRPFLPPPDPRFKLLMTTRLELGRLVKRFTISELDEDSALLLLESIAGAARVQAERTEAKLLCKWVGYLPLGLKLLGQGLADDMDLSILELLDELEDVGLEAAALQGITDEPGVLQTLELSWQALDEDEQALACLLGMFALAPIPFQLVKSCCPNVDERALKQRHKGLIQRSLLSRVGSGAYQLHQIVQEFFRVKLAQKGEAGEALKASFCSALVAVAKKHRIWAYAGQS